MKLRRSDVNLIFIALGLIIGLCAWQFVYKSYNEKTDALNAENATLQTEVDYLQDLADHKQQYLDETASMNAEIDEIKAQFPAEYRAEDDIMYIRGLEQDYDTFVTTLGIGLASAIEVAQPEPVMPVATEESDDPTEEAAEAPAPADAAPVSDVLLYSTPLNVEMKSSYMSVKDIIGKINTDRDRKSLEMVTMSFDSETGDLIANMNYNAYSLSGTEKVYQTPEISGIRYGTNNIFNSAERKQAADAMRAAAAAAAEE